jgi:hypothetical protein
MLVMNAIALGTDPKRARLVWGLAFVLSMGAAGGLVGSADLGFWGSLAIVLVPMLLLVPLVRAAQRAQAELGCLTLATQRYNRRIVFVSLAYVAALFTAMGVTRETHVGGALLWLIALLPSLPIIAMVWAMGRFLVEETDEYQKMRTIRASLVATGLLLTCASVWGFLEMFGLVPHLWLWAVFPAWAIGLGLGQLANRWMFHDKVGC